MFLLFNERCDSPKCFEIPDVIMGDTEHHYITFAQSEQTPSRVHRPPIEKYKLQIIDHSFLSPRFSSISATRPNIPHPFTLPYIQIAICLKDSSKRVSAAFVNIIQIA